MSTYLEKLTFMGIATHIAAHVRTKKALTKESAQGYLRSNGNVILADMLEAIPDDEWDFIAKQLRRF